MMDFQRLSTQAVRQILQTLAKCIAALGVVDTKSGWLIGKFVQILEQDAQMSNGPNAAPPSPVQSFLVELALLALGETGGGSGNLMIGLLILHTRSEVHCVLLVFQ
jgi:hypothetical protein